jgi:hypothetical protein
MIFIAFSSEVDTGSRSNQVYADCVDLSAVENASKLESRASVLIQSESKLERPEEAAMREALIIAG